MKKKQVTAILLSGILAVSSCLPMGTMNVLAAENTAEVATAEETTIDEAAGSEESDSSAASVDNSTEGTDSDVNNDTVINDDSQTGSSEEVTTSQEGISSSNGASVDDSSNGSSSENSLTNEPAQDESSDESSTDTEIAPETEESGDTSTDSAAVTEDEVDLEKEEIEDGDESDIKKDAKLGGPGSSFKDATRITVGEAANLSIYCEEYEQYYCYFIPEETSTYRVHYSSADGCYLYGTLYDESRSYIGNYEYNNGSREIVSLCQAGKKYYVGIEGEEGEHSITLSVEKSNDFWVEARGSRDKEVCPGESLTLGVDAFSSDTLSFEWYKDNELISGASSNEYTFTPDHNCNVKCVVTSGNETKDVSYRVRIDNSLSASAGYPQGEDNYGNTLYRAKLSPSNPTLKVNAYALDMEGITYQWRLGTWYDDDCRFTDIEGANASTYTPELARNSYACVVTDRYGNTNTVLIDTEVDNHLSISFDGYDTEQPVINANVGDSVTLHVIATADDASNLNYSWYSNNNLIENETTETLTIDSVNESMSIRCEVRDPYKGYADASLEIRIDNGLKVYDQSNENSKFIRINAAPGESITLDPIVEINDDEGAEYKWYKYTDIYGDFEDCYGKELIENANNTSYTFTPAEDKAAYQLFVTDRYGNSDYVQYNVKRDNNLKVYPEGNTADDNSIDITINPGETASLKTIVTAAITEGIQYQWYKDNELIGGENSDTLSTPVDTTGTYKCSVTDQFGTTGEAIFNVRIDNGLTLIPDGNSSAYNKTKTIYAMPGETVTLNTAVAAEDSTDLNYTWYKDGNIISEATRSSYEASIDAPAVYKCEVSDQYGSTDSVLFNVLIDNRLVVYPEGAHDHGTVSTIYGSPSEGTVLRTIVSANDMESLTYSWKALIEPEVWDEWENIEGADSSEYVLTADDLDHNQFSCTVSDPYGNSRKVTFKFVNPVNPETTTKFKAYPEGASYEENGTQREYYPYVTIKSGAAVEPITLRAIVETDHPESIQYDWGDGNVIVGTSGSSIVVTPRKSKWYECNITDTLDSDNTAQLTFMVVKNSFEARVEGVEGLDYDLSYANINLTPGQEYTLRAIVTADDRSGLRYRWSRGGYNNTVGTDDSLTITATKEEGIECTVEDTYGNSTDLYYYIHVGGFTATPAGTDKVNGNAGWIYLKPNEKRILSADVEDVPGAEYTYEWVDFRNGYTLLSEEPTFELDGTKNGDISCYVRNQYGTSVLLNYTYKVNHFSIYGDSKDIDVSHYNLYQAASAYKHKADPITGCDLKVNVNADDMTGMKYTWSECRMTNPEADFEEDKYSFYPIASGTDTIHVNPGGDAVYKCYVEDRYGNSSSINYYVTVDGNLSVSPGDIEGSAYNSTLNRVTLNATEGETITLSADASISDDSALFYTWQSRSLEGSDGAGDLNNGWSSIGTGTNSINVTAGGNTRYECVVYDRYGNTATVSYDILTSSIVPVEEIELNKTETRLSNQQTEKLMATVLPVNATVKTVKWESSDNSVATVKSDGTITGYDKGIATITATSDDGSVSATCTVKVKNGSADEPAIIEQPSDVTGKLGEKVSFRVQARGEMLTYRWEYRNVNDTTWKEWSGKTDAEVYVTATTSNNGLLYRCIVSDGVDSVTSEPAKLTLYQGPIFITEPEDFVAEIGEQATFHAEATGTNVSYQWEYSTDNGANWIEMEGENGTEITVEVSNDTDGNLYRCVAGNGTESTASEPAKLSVSKAPIITKQPENVSVKNGQKASFRVEAVGYTSGEELSYQWEYRKNESEGWREWSGKTSAEAAATAGPSNNGFLYRCKVSNESGTAVSEAAQLTLYEGPEITSQPEDAEAASGEQVTFLVSATGENLAYQWEYSSDGGESWNNCENGNGSEITVVAGEDTYGNLYRCTVSNSGGSVSSEPAELKAFSGPVITKQPEDVTVKSGQKAIFRVEASGNEGEELSYQWQYKRTGTDSWNIWTGKTEAEASATATASNDGFLYRCIVTGVSGSVTSTEAKLTLYKGPEITSQPEDVEVAAGGQATFSIEATGEDLAYQWEYSSDNGASWNSCENGTGAEITVVAGDNTYGNLYRCTVSNSGGSVTSEPAELKAYSGPVITKQPEDVSVKSGQKATFRIEATGNEGEELSYQWEYRKNENEGWRVWTGKTSAEATATAGPSNDGFLYRCKVSNSAGTAISETAQLTLYAGPEITSQPEDVEVAAGEQATFSVAATGEDLAYQWEYSTDGGESWNSCENGTGTEITVEAGEDTYGNLYRCTVSNSGGSATSEPAELKAFRGPVITKQPEDVSVKSGQKATFRIEATGNEGEELSYQWEYRKNENEGWRVWTGKTGAEATATAGPSNDGFLYRCKVSNSAGTAISETAQLTLYAGPEITSQPEDVEVAAGGQATFSVAATGEDLVYQWEYSSDNGESWNSCENGIGAEITVEAREDTYGNLYRCTVSNSGGSVTSEPAELKAYSGPVITRQPEDVTAYEGQKVTFRIEATGNEGEELSYQWEYRKNENEGWRVWTGKTSAEATATAGPSNNGFQYRCKVSNNAGTAVSEAAQLTLHTSIRIISQPEDVESHPNMGAEFSIVAEGENLTYQWEYSSDNGESWNNCEGENSAKYNVFVGQNDFGNLYRCIVSNSEGSVISETATLIECKGPVISNPHDIVAPNGQKASFKVEASNTEGNELSYQWEYKRPGSESWSEWVGKTSSEATVVVSPSNNGLLYRCKVSDEVGTTTSQPAKLIMYQGPIINDQPEDFTTIAGNVTSIQSFVIVLDEDDVEVRWQYSADNGNSWNDFTDYIDVGIVYIDFVATEEMDGYLFRCIRSDSYGSVTSEAARLTIYRDFYFTSQPESVTARLGDEVTFRAEAVDLGSEDGLGYEWYRVGENDNLIHVGFDQVLTVVASEENENYLYICQVYGRYGYLRSEPVSITIDRTPEITVQPEDAYVSESGDEPAVFYIEATSHESLGELHYQWECSTDDGESWNDCQGENSASLVINDIVNGDGNLYRCAVSNDYETTTSNSARLSIDRRPWVTLDPVSVTEDSGNMVTFTVGAEGPENWGELHYQWQYFIGDMLDLGDSCMDPDSEEWINCEGMTGTEMTFEFTGDNQGWYRCVISNDYGKVCSGYAMLSYPIN